mgnify:CR=1 FL=1
MVISLVRCMLCLRVDMCALLFRTDNLSELAELGPQVVEQAARVCETYFQKKMPHRECFITRVLFYVIDKALQADSSAAGVTLACDGCGVGGHSRRRQGSLSYAPCLPHAAIKRLWALREGLDLFDFADPSIEGLKHALLQCMMSPCMLRCKDGQRFLVSLFELDLTMVSDLYAVILAQVLASCFPFRPFRVSITLSTPTLTEWRPCVLLAGPFLQAIDGRGIWIHFVSRLEGIYRADAHRHW